LAFAEGPQGPRNDPPKLLVIGIRLAIRFRAHVGDQRQRPRQWAQLSAQKAIGQGIEVCARQLDLLALGAKRERRAELHSVWGQWMAWSAIQQ